MIFQTCHTRLIREFNSIHHHIKPTVKDHCTAQRFQHRHLRTPHQHSLRPQTNAPVTTTMVTMIHRVTFIGYHKTQMQKKKYFFRRKKKENNLLLHPPAVPPAPPVVPVVPPVVAQNDTVFQNRAILITMSAVVVKRMKRMMMKMNTLVGNFPPKSQPNKFSDVRYCPYKIGVNFFKIGPLGL